MLIVLFTGIANASNHKKCIFLSNQKCWTQPTFINFYLNEYSQELHYSPFIVKLDRCVVILLMTYLTNYVFQTKQKI